MEAQSREKQHGDGSDEATQDLAVPWSLACEKRAAPPSRKQIIWHLVKDR
jgi:hypothetical protein